MGNETWLTSLIRDLESVNSNSKKSKFYRFTHGPGIMIRLQNLEEWRRFALWEHILLAQTGPEKAFKRRQKIMKFILDAIPESPTAAASPEKRRRNETVFKLALTKNDLVPEDLLIRMVGTMPERIFSDLLLYSNGDNFFGQFDNHPWVVAVSNQVPNNVLREIHNRSKFTDKDHFFYWFCYDIGTNREKKIIDISNKASLETFRFLLSIDPMVAKRNYEWPQNLPFHSFLNGWLPVVSKDQDCYTSEKHITIMLKIADLLIDDNPLALETPMKPTWFLGYKRINEMIPLVYACRRASNMRLRTYEDIKMGVLDVASSIIFFILKKYPKGALCKVFLDTDLEASPSTPLEFIQNKVLAQQVLLKIGDSVETMTALSTLRDIDTGDTILHVLANRKTINCAQLEYDQNCSDYAGTYSYNKIKRIANYNQRFSTTIMYHGLIELLPELTMVQNQNGDLPIHVRLKSEETKDFFEDVSLLTKANDRAIISTMAAVADGVKPNGHKTKKKYCQDTHTGTGIPSFVVAAMYPPEKTCLKTVHFLLQRYAEQHGGLRHYTIS